MEVVHWQLMDVNECVENGERPDVALVINGVAKAAWPAPVLADGRDSFQIERFYVAA